MVIGVGTFSEGSGLDPLPSVEEDVDRMTYWLRTTGDYTVKKLKNKTEMEIQKGIKAFVEKKKLSSKKKPVQFVVYLSGHGSSKSGAPRLFTRDGKHFDVQKVS